MTDLIIRTAAPHERETIADLTRASYLEFSASYDAEPWRRYEESTRQTLLSADNNDQLVAELNGQLVGAVLLCQPYEKDLGHVVIKNPYPEFRLLAVLPEFRVHKVGRALIDACEQHFAEQGFDAISLHTTPVMQVAKAMYERRGYVRYPEIDFKLGSGFDVFGYRKPLTSQRMPAASLAVVAE